MRVSGMPLKLFLLRLFFAYVNPQSIFCHTLPVDCFHGGSLRKDRENRVGRLACIGCSRAATLLNTMPLFLLQRFLHRATNIEIEWLGIAWERARKKRSRRCFAFVAALWLRFTSQIGMDRSGYYRNPSLSGLGTGYQGPWGPSAQHVG